MQPVTKTYAQFVDYNYQVSAPDQAVEVQNEQDAVEQALKNRAMFVQTYEMTSVDTGSEILTGKPKNFSDRLYVGTKFYTQAEVLSEVEKSKRPAPHPTLVDLFKRAHETVLNNIAQMPADSAFIAYGRIGEFSALKSGEKVFDANGQQAWPAKTAVVKPQSAPAL